MAQPRYTNRLAQEKSPYLLQHAHNPVDWFPWSEEALAKARREDKPIFLSIGYSTCHWCHVMERESFEDPEVAAVLNTLTVPIKVDREERPDLDHVYMTVCQSLTGSGGWPLNLLLTPDREAFFAGTYFPKHSRPGRIGLVELVRQAAALWQSQRDKVVESAAGILERIRALTAGSAPEEFTPRLLSAAEDTFRGDFDPQRGGFGTAPKFPTPHNLAFLLRRYRRSSDPDLLAMVETTLEAMRRGGIYDHVGFGFHRYSTDADWLLPHFEKMLYDQAGLLSTYAEAYQATRDPGHERTLREICTYVLTTLREPKGGFHSAEDADSEGVEGKFYLWTREEILEVLGRPVGEAYCEVHGVRPEGNFRDEASGQLTGANVLHLERSLADWSTAKGIPEEVFRTRVETARHKLLQRRETRVRPHRDDKIVTGWNGLMISALSRAAWVTGDREYAAAAAGAADFLLTNLYRDGRLLRSFRQGAAAVGAFAEDYAFLARGLLDLYLPTLDSGRLVQALDLSGRLLSLFWDREHGGLFDTAEDAETLVIRPREVYDGATPSANSVALELFARLGQLTGNPLWPERARSLLAACTARVKQYPAGFTQFLQGAALVTEPTREIVIAGHSGAESTRALLAVVRNAYAPETSLLHLPDGDGREAVVRTAPFTREMRSLDGRAAAFVCQGFACRSPLTDPQELAALLRDPPSP